MSPAPVESLRQIDSACDRFEAEWLAGHRPRVEDFLSHAPALDQRAWLSAIQPLADQPPRDNRWQGEAQQHRPDSGTGLGALHEIPSERHPGKDVAKPGDHGPNPEPPQCGIFAQERENAHKP